MPLATTHCAVKDWCTYGEGTLSETRVPKTVAGTLIILPHMEILPGVQRGEMGILFCVVLNCQDWLFAFSALAGIETTMKHNNRMMIDFIKAAPGNRRS
jgi:hypothetical protein